jgi:hypothetical protein
MTRASPATILSRQMAKQGTRTPKTKVPARGTKKTTATRALPLAAKNAKKRAPSKKSAPPRRAKKQEPPLRIPLSFAAVAAAFARDRRVTLERGWGVDNVVLKLNAKIFAMFARGQLVTKLPKARVDELVSAGEGARFDPRRNGRLMKEWLVVASGESKWVDVTREAYQFVKAELH